MSQFSLDEYDSIYHNPNRLVAKDATTLMRVLCSLCHRIMKQPSQTECGCRFCRECILSYRSHNNMECPTCKQQSINVDRLFNDKAVERDIMNLSIKCIESDCTTIIAFKDRKCHAEICLYRLETCTKCNQPYRLSEREEHMSRECDLCTVICEFCGIEMTKMDYESKHRNVDGEISTICVEWCAKCPYKCADDIESEPVNLVRHLKTCPNRPTECAMVAFGCQERRRMPRVDMEKHTSTAVAHHCALLVALLGEMRADIVRVRTEGDEKAEQLDIELHRLTESNVKNSAEVNRLEGQIERLEASLCRPVVASGNEGVVTWTIAGIRDKISIARADGGTGTDDRIESEPFYLHGNGYRMSLKVYPNGDGRAKAECVSVFFSLHRGDHDDGLPWPFQSKVTLSLLGNGGGSDHPVVVKSVRMKPDHNVACYGRPQGRQNVAAGQPQFVRIDDVMNSDRYVVEGALVLRMEVEAPHQSLSSL